MNRLLLVLERHAHSEHGDESCEPPVAAFGGLEDLLEFVEHGGVDGALEAGEEVFQLAIGHARGGEVVGIGGAAGVRVHALERRVFAFLGDGERVRHYEGYDNKAEDFAEQLGLEQN
jgi:hypothetical protein